VVEYVFLDSENYKGPFPLRNLVPVTQMSMFVYAKRAAIDKATYIT
jgi:hypothetical protein